MTKKLACISQMWMSWFSSAVSNRAGTCHSTITRLKEMSAVHGLHHEPPHRPQRMTTRRPSSTARTSAPSQPDRAGRAGGGATGRPATMRIGAKKAMRMCSIMWTKK